MYAISHSEIFLQCSSTHFTPVQYEGCLGFPKVKEKILPCHKKCCIKQHFFPSPSAEEDFFCHFQIQLFTKVLALHSSLLYAEFLLHTLLLMPTGYPNFPDGIKTQSPWHPGNSAPQECSWYQVMLSSLGLCSCLGGDL